MDTRTQVVLGSGAYRYRVVQNWAKLPEGWEFKDVAAVAVDSRTAFTSSTAASTR